MLALTDRYTVPQVFFNETYIGGADETIQLLSEWDEELKSEKKNKTAKDRYLETIEAEAGPYDVRLSIPTGPPAMHYMNLTVNRPKEITEVNEKHFTTLQLTRELIKKMPRRDLSTFGFGVFYYNSFVGSEAVSVYDIEWPYNRNVRYINAALLYICVLLLGNCAYGNLWYQNKRGSSSVGHETAT